ncbi:MAG: type IV secretory system conjugative DNA transfer family protein [Bacillota bacterium]|nr:type IV secretory system conjugative DNA transfer family protein [Bacillota bacterium]
MSIATANFGYSLQGKKAKGNNYFRLSKNQKLRWKDLFTHVGIVAPSGVGKTAGILLPNLLSKNLAVCSKIIFDPKGEIYNLTSRYRESLGEKCILYEPLGIHNKHGYNILEQCTEFQEVRGLAENILNASIEKVKDTTFLELSKPLLTAILLHLWYLKDSGLNNINTALSMLLLPLYELEKNFVNNPDKRVYQQFLLFKQGGDSEATMSCMKLSVATALQLYSDPRLSKSTAKSTFNAADIRKTPTNLYIKYSFAKADYLRPFLNVFLSQLLEKSCFDNPEYELLFMVDEVQNIGRIQSIDKYLNIGRHYGMSIILAMQNITKMYDIYGRDQTMTILNGLQTKIVGCGISDLDFLNYISLLGSDTEVNEVENGKNIKKSKKLMTTDEIRRMYDDECLIVNSNNKYIKDRIYYYYNDVKLMDNALRGLVWI